MVAAGEDAWIGTWDGAADCTVGAGVSATGFDCSLVGDVASATCEVGVMAGDSATVAGEAIGGSMTATGEVAGAAMGRGGRRSCVRTSLRRASSRVRQ